jgi:peptidoglycan glycosyltransferase
MAVAVLVEHGGYGSAAAAPIARDLLVRANELGLLQ